MMLTMNDNGNCVYDGGYTVGKIRVTMMMDGVCNEGD